MDPFIFLDQMTNPFLARERGKVTAPRHWHSCSGGVGWEQHALKKD